jgi:ring-1,2-phenylacetyl-CoA epoxidase subunit PaaD
MKVIEDDVILALQQAGIPKVEAHRVYSPAWSTNWMSAEARLKLKEYGIAAPQVLEETLVQIGGEAGAFAAPQARGAVSCPFCDSEKTELRSEFGATACKAFYFCQGCRQPFELFKAI